MTRDSEPPYSARIVKLAGRFEDAVRKSFGFLHELGFNQCDPVNSGMDDLRDALISHRFTRGRVAVDLHFSFLTFQIQLVLLSFGSAATCQQNQKATKVMDLEAWVREHGSTESKLKWMRSPTLWEEMMRSYGSYAKNIDRNMEDAVELLARRLRASGLLEDANFV